MLKLTCMPSARSTKATVTRAVFPAVGKTPARARFSYGLNSVVQPDMHPLLSMLAPHSKDIKKKRGSRGCFMTDQSQYLEILSAYRAPAGQCALQFYGQYPGTSGRFGLPAAQSQEERLRPSVRASVYQAADCQATGPHIGCTSAYRRPRRRSALHGRNGGIDMRPYFQ